MNLYLSTNVFPIISLVVWCIFGIFLGVMLLRLIFNYSDPNPFGKVGRFGFKVRKATEKWVYPASRFLAMYRVDTRLAPLLTLFIGLVLTYFSMQIVGNTFFVIDGLSAGVATGNPKVFVGFVIYGLLSLLVLFIFIRFISSWFVFTQKTFLGFVRRVTDPILLPVQRLIPPIGMFDISAMIVLLLIGFLQSIVLRVFVTN
ncbi:MAG: YggT family protein [Pyrinomonadaceae bacterium]|nr:YggT family protein [Pyrinomonadaceae bacterium]MBP6211595.1 YggT family protein [Pyrinomonadaceae bacterium]